MEHSMGIPKMMANNRQAANPKAFKMNTSLRLYASDDTKILARIQAGFGL